MEKFQATMKEFVDWHKAAQDDLKKTFLDVINKNQQMKQQQSNYMDKLHQAEIRIYQLEADKDKLQSKVEMLVDNNRMLMEHNSRQDDLAQCAVQLANANFASTTAKSGSSTPLNNTNNNNNQSI